MSHEVYVIYRDGEPIKGKRSAYYTKGDARAAIKHLAKGAVMYWYLREHTEEYEAEVSRYTVVPYIAKEVSE